MVLEKGGARRRLSFLDAQSQALTAAITTDISIRLLVRFQSASATSADF